MKDADLVRALKAIADPTRFRMLQVIASAGELTCSGVVELFDVSQPTISHHLKILTDEGLLVRRTEGKHHFTSVNHELLREIGELVSLRVTPAGPKRKKV